MKLMEQKHMDSRWLETTCFYDLRSPINQEVSSTCWLEYSEVSFNHLHYHFTCIGAAGQLLSLSPIAQ